MEGKYLLLQQQVTASSYMINWINGQTTRFKCLVCHDGVFDTMGGYFSTDELWFEEWEFDGVPWKNPSSICFVMYFLT